MSSIPVPDEQTHYSSQRQDDVDALSWPVFSQRALDLLRSAGEVLHPEPGELLWDAGDPYDLYLVLVGGVLLLDRRNDRVVFVIEEGDFVGELGMLMGQRAFLPGVAMEETAVLRVRVEELRRLVEISGGAKRRPALRVRRPAAFVEENGGGRSSARRRRRPRPTPASGVCRAQPASVPDRAALGGVGLVRAGEDHRTA
jgi:hypothetical protein